jgi:hypothetical protein
MARYRRMPNRSSKRPDEGLDVVQNAKRVFDEALRRSEDGVEVTISRSTISLVMSEMGRKGGRIGGKRRLVTMTPERRSEIGKLAAEKRWGKKKKAKK